MKESKRRDILEIAGPEAQRLLPLLYGIDQSFRVAEYMFQYCVMKGIVGAAMVRLCEDKQWLPIRVGKEILARMDVDRFRPLTWDDLK
jgi:hypothetical protein